MISKICKQYLEALNKGDLNKVLSLFSTDAVVVSPLYGTKSAQQFYKELFMDTSQSDTRLLNIFESSEKKLSAALHFQYKWTLKNGNIINFQCVDIFELSKDKNQFTKLTIIYDTAPILNDFKRS